MKIKRLLIGFIATALLFSALLTASPDVFAINDENAPVPYASLTVNGSEEAQIYNMGTYIGNSSENVILDIETENVDSCSLYRGNTKISNILNGRVAFTVIYALQDTDTYTLKCTGPYGNVQDTAKLGRLITPKVDTPKPGEPIVNITANDQDILGVVENSEVTIKWTSQNADSCTVTRYFHTGLEGEFTLNHVFDGIYIVYCYNSVGSSYDFVKVFAIPPRPATLQLNGVSNTEVEYGGGDVTLTWDAHESYKCMLSAPLPDDGIRDTIMLNDYYVNNGQPLPSSSGTMTVTVDSNKSYRLICDSPYSRLIANGTVTVKPISFGYVLSEVEKLSESLGRGGAVLSPVQQAISTSSQAYSRGDSRLAKQKLNQALTHLDKLMSTGKLTESDGTKLKNNIDALLATL